MPVTPEIPHICRQPELITLTPGSVMGRNEPNRLSVSFGTLIHCGEKPGSESLCADHESIFFFFFADTMRMPSDTRREAHILKTIGRNRLQGQTRSRDRPSGRGADSEQIIRRGAIWSGPLIWSAGQSISPRFRPGLRLSRTPISGP